MSMPPSYLEALDEGFEEMLREEAADHARRNPPPPKLDPQPIQLRCTTCGPQTLMAAKCVSKGDIFCPRCFATWPMGVSLGYRPGEAPLQASVSSTSRAQAALL